MRHVATFAGNSVEWQCAVHIEVQRCIVVKAVVRFAMVSYIMIKLPYEPYAMVKLHYGKAMAKVRRCEGRTMAQSNLIMSRITVCSQCSFWEEEPEWPNNTACYGQILRLKAYIQRIRLIEPPNWIQFNWLDRNRIIRLTETKKFIIAETRKSFLNKTSK